MSALFGHAMPLMILVLCAMAIAYRYYSAFIAAKVATLDDSRPPPSELHNDGHNFHPTNKWVLFGHHFAAISGAGPLIGPVLAAQFGYLPGLLWIVIGVCLAGAVQDFLVLVASMRRGGRSLAQIAFSDVGKVAGTAATIAIIFITVIALAGLGKVVVKALGGDAITFPPRSVLRLPATGSAAMNATQNRMIVSTATAPQRSADGTYRVPPGATLLWGGSSSAILLRDSLQGHVSIGEMKIDEPFVLRSKTPLKWEPMALFKPGQEATTQPAWMEVALPADAVRLVPGSSWGTFTIACTIPIALFIGLYLYKIRPGKVVEASLIGGALTIGATVLGGFVHNSSFAHWFNLSGTQATWSMAIYGFIASVLPVWVLLCPRDYLSSFLKIGTIILLVAGTLIANPKLEAPAYNATFASGGPVLGPTAKIFPFLFITVMCGAISGFHALVSSGTTPKMIKRESDARTIGYGAMLIEGLVGVVAMIAAATLPVGDYYAMNTALDKAPQFHEQILKIPGGGIEHMNEYESLTQESLRGRTGGAVTLAVGMAHIFDGAAQRFLPAADATVKSLWKYWYHFAIMFEALFILTTIDTGTRIGRFLLQEVAGHLHPSLGIKGGVLSAIVSTGLIVFGWAWFMNSDSFDTIWKMFGVANQMLAVIALAIVSAYLVNAGRSKYLWVTIVPMVIVLTTTTTAACYMLSGQIDGIATQLQKQSAERNAKLLLNSIMQAGAIVVVLGCGLTVVIAAAARVLGISKDNRQGAKSAKIGEELQTV